MAIGDINEQFQRTQLLIGDEALKKLMYSHVIVFGVGGVGGYVCEALVRAGIGAIDIVDNDSINVSNLNRQIIALHSTIGIDKVDAISERLLDINPGLLINKHKCFYLPDTRSEFDFGKFDYVIDCIDTITAKLDLAEAAGLYSTPIISSMGTGNKLHPEMLEISDIYKTEMDPLSRVMRRELKKRGVKALKVVYSKEQPLKANAGDKDGDRRKAVPGSISFVPPVAGFIIAGEVVRDLIKNDISLN